MAAQQADGVDLISAIDQRNRAVRTRSLDVSFNELFDMYSDEELIISPEYQRLFRWSADKQSRFIESLLLELPVPPIFVVESEEGIYELIDGLQRISSYLHFRGSLPRREEEDELFPRFLTLTGCDIVTELNGFTYETLPQALQIKLKRNFVRMEVIRKESDERLRYYMFKRLNTGGENLSDQEIRNCVIRLLDNTFNEHIIKMSEHPDFMECISNISDEQRNQRYDQELVLRFYAFKNHREKYVHDVGDFMTDYMEAVSDPQMPDIHFDYEEETRVFDRTFKILRATLGEHAFSKLNPHGNFVSKVLSYHYEAFTQGLQPYIDQFDPVDDGAMRNLEQALRRIKADPQFIELTTGGGKNYARYLAQRIEVVEKGIGAAG